MANGKKLRPALRDMIEVHRGKVVVLSAVSTRHRRLEPPDKFILFPVPDLHTPIIGSCHRVYIIQDFRRPWYNYYVEKSILDAHGKSILIGCAIGAALSTAVLVALPRCWSWWNREGARGVRAGTGSALGLARTPKPCIPEPYRVAWDNDTPTPDTTRWTFTTTT